MRILAETGQSHCRFATNIASSPPAFIGWFGIRCMSFFLLAIAQLLLLPNWFAGATGLIGVGVLYAFRIRQEERMMMERFGAEYRDYIAHTARLIPWLV